MTIDPLDPLVAALSRDGAASSDFDLNPDFKLPQSRKLRPAGVLAGFVMQDGVPQVILTKRSSALKHHPGQIGAPEPPFEATMPLKFINPWRIKVPDGYSVLFTQPMNRPDLPFACFSGLVDCDRFETTVNMPFVWTGPPGQHVLSAGTPIAQLIPIRRDALLKDHLARESSEAEREREAAARQRKYHEESTYSREWRVKK